MSTVDTRPNTDLMYRTVAAFMAFIAVGTVVRIVWQVFGEPAIEPIGLGIAIISMMVLCLTVVSAAPFRRNLGSTFKRVVSFSMACNIGSHLVWLATLTIGGSS